MMIHRNVLIFLSLFLLQGGWTVAAPLSQQEMYRLAQEAERLFQEGNHLLSTDTEQAHQRYRQAILRYQRIIQDGNVENLYLYYNIGNIYLMDGDLGRAILNYTRAEEFERFDDDLQKNLAYARLQRKDQITPGVERQVLQTLLFWHYDLGQRTKWIVLLTGWALLCLVAAGAFWSRSPRRFRVALGLLGLLVLVMAGSLAVQVFHESRDAEGVIVQKEVVARQGNGANYPASFDQPLHAGTEFVLLEQRQEWWQVRLVNGVKTWLPADSVELVRPRQEKT